MSMEDPNPSSQHASTQWDSSIVVTIKHFHDDRNKIMCRWFLFLESFAIQWSPPLTHNRDPSKGSFLSSLFLPILLDASEGTKPSSNIKMKNKQDTYAPKRVCMKLDPSPKTWTWNSFRRINPSSVHGGWTKIKRPLGPPWYSQKGLWGYVDPLKITSSKLDTIEGYVDFQRVLSLHSTYKECGV